MAHIQIYSLQQHLRNQNAELTINKGLVKSIDIHIMEYFTPTNKEESLCIDMEKFLK